MNSGTLRALTFVAALGCGVAAGVFFAFSSFVMAGLARLPAGQGIRAMQEINVTAVTPPFMLQLFGTATLCLVLALFAFLRRGERGAILILVGAGLYLVGTILVTMFGNVPLNDALAAAKSDSPDAAQLWGRFLREWTIYNHVRTLSSLLASASLFGSLLSGWEE